MSLHKMSLQEKYYEFILHGTKRIELRLFDEKRRAIEIGDFIEFLKVNSDESFKARVVGLLRYRSFAELVRDFEIAVLADESLSKEELLADLEEFYIPEKQRRYGVVGIRVELT